MNDSSERGVGPTCSVEVFPMNTRWLTSLLFTCLGTACVRSETSAPTTPSVQPTSAELSTTATYLESEVIPAARIDRAKMHRALDAHGRWTVTAQFGEVWQP